MLLRRRSILTAIALGMFLGIPAEHAVAANTVWVQQDTAIQNGTPQSFFDNAPINLLDVANDIIRIRIWHDEYGMGDIPEVSITGSGTTRASVILADSTIMPNEDTHLFKSLAEISAESQQRTEIFLFTGVSAAI